MSFKSKLYNIVIDDKTVGGKRFDIFIMTLIVISLITFPLETLNIDNDLFFQILNFSEIFCVAIFSVEYLLRVYLSKNRLQYIF